MLAGLDEELSSMTSRRDEVAEHRKTKQDEAHKYREALREERQEHDKTINITHELQMKIQELEQKLRQLEERAREEFEIPQIERREYAGDDTFSFGDSREIVREIKQKIKNLGAVNLLAYNEFQKESERLQFLTTQRGDLADAQKNLTNMIEEINQTATTQFLSTFEQIRENFQNIFQTLFAEGDTCNLSLQEEKDPLEAQIEILAQPRGKKPHSIDLLSSGEKTLTAIALLFAIYLVKPSPFCILDEVDAPLDDNAIDRFLSIIRRFAGNTQFIVVTHNKRTMACRRRTVRRDPGRGWRFEDRKRTVEEGRNYYSRQRKAGGVACRSRLGDFLFSRDGIRLSLRANRMHPPVWQRWRDVNLVVDISHAGNIFCHLFNHSLHSTRRNLAT